MKYDSIVPAQDWFFCHANPDPSKPDIVYPVAVWASYQISDDEGPGTKTVIVGLIAPDFGGQHHAKLTTPPPVPGRYVHISDLPKAVTPETN
jgi:hypothetical protein